MARRVFFSFHYERDVWRASVVRNSYVTKGGEAGYVDAGMWEEAKLKGKAALQQLIDTALVGSSVTAVLIGSETASRDWVKYEIDQSMKGGKGLVGIYIHGIADKNGRTATKGPNPFAGLVRSSDQVSLTSIYSTYDWVLDGGYANLGSWVEAAAKAAGK